MTHTHFNKLIRRHKGASWNNFSVVDPRDYLATEIDVNGNVENECK